MGRASRPRPAPRHSGHITSRGHGVAGVATQPLRIEALFVRCIQCSNEQREDTLMTPEDQERELEGVVGESEQAAYAAHG